MSVMNPGSIPLGQPTPLDEQGPASGLGQLPQAQNPGPQQPQPYIPEWSQPLNLELQRLQGGMAQLDKDEFSNSLLPEHAQAMRQQLGGRVAVLQQSQQRAQAKAQQTQKAAAMDAEALQFSIQQTHSVKEAQGTQQVVGRYVDPVTGRGFYTVPEGGKNGKRSIVHDNELEPDASGQEGGQSPGSIGASAPVPEQNVAPVTQPGQSQSLQDVAAKVTGKSGESKNSPETPPLGGQSRQGGSLPRILNASGEDITERQAQQYRDMQGTPRDELGRPTGPPPAREGEMGGGKSGKLQPLTDAGLRQLYQRADAAVPRLRPNASPHLQLHRQEQVGTLAQKMADNHNARLRHDEHRESIRLQAEANQKLQAQQHKEKLEMDLQQHRQKLEQTALTNKTEQGFKPEHLVDLIHKTRNTVEDRYQDYLKDAAKAFKDGGTKARDEAMARIPETLATPTARALTVEKEIQTTMDLFNKHSGRGQPGGEQNRPGAPVSLGDKKDQDAADALEKRRQAAEGGKPTEGPRRAYPAAEGVGLPSQQAGSAPSQAAAQALPPVDTAAGMFYRGRLTFKGGDQATTKRLREARDRAASAGSSGRARKIAEAARIYDSYGNHKELSAEAKQKLEEGFKLAGLKLE